jgi:dihydroflavonol-4-reductase
VKALVTGASGFIGGAVARALAGRGATVRAFIRAGSVANVGAVPVEIATGDLRDRNAIRRAAAGCDAIFHAGGLYSFFASRDELVACNVDGTRNVLEVARELGVRVVHTSSISTIGGVTRGTIPDEGQTATTIPGPYKESKWLAEELVRDYATRDVDAVIVNPTFPVGWGDIKPTPTGQVIRDFLDGHLPAYVDTGMNVVDVDDVAVGHVLAFERGQRGERYILGNANLTMRELLVELGRIAGRKPPRVRIPHAIALGLAHANALVGKVRVPLEAVRTASEVRFANPARAIRELGMPQTPVAIALDKAVSWFRDTRTTGVA